MAGVNDKAEIGTTGKFLEGVSVDTPAGADLFREGVVVSDPVDPEARQRVTNSKPLADDFGAVVRVAGLVQPTTPADTQPISAAALPLPTGAATAAKQLPDNHNVTVSNLPLEPLTGANSSVAASVTAVTLLASNGARRGATVYNDSTSSLRLSLGNVVTDSSFTLIVAGGGYYEVPFGYRGAIAGLWAAAIGAARVTELT